ncbi:MAG: hypothetical protein LBJ33_03955 [Pseudomonas putida]|nr:hypothetical protein [Pseudomonas putida]
MRKPFAFALMLAAAMGLAACDKASENKAPETKTEQAAPEAAPATPAPEAAPATPAPQATPAPETAPSEEPAKQ